MDYKQFVQQLKKHLWGDSFDPDMDLEPGPGQPSSNPEEDPLERILARCSRNVEALRGGGNLGVDTDEMPQGYGAFGYDVTNPIPTLGIPGSNEYLASLRTSQGHPLKWERMGCYTAPNIEHLIDGYEIVDEHTGLFCGMLYLCPYNKRTSVKPPQGLYMKSRPW